MTSDGKNYRIFDWHWQAEETMDPIPLLLTIVNHLGDKGDAVFRQMELELRLVQRTNALSQAILDAGFQYSGAWMSGPSWSILGAEIGGEPFADLVCENDFKNVVLPAIGTFSTEERHPSGDWARALAKHIDESLKKDVKLRALQFIETTETLTTDPDHPRWEGGLLADRDRWYSKAAIDMGVEIQQTTIASASSKHVIKIQNDSDLPVSFTRLDGKSSLTVNAGYKGGLTENQVNDSGWKIELVRPDPEPITPVE